MIISADKTEISLAKLINEALKTDKTVVLESGNYELDGTIYMPDDSSLVLRDGVILKAKARAFDKARTGRSTRPFWTSRWITCWTLFLPRRKRSRAAAFSTATTRSIVAKIGKPDRARAYCSILSTWTAWN